MHTKQKKLKFQGPSTTLQNLTKNLNTCKRILKKRNSTQTVFYASFQPYWTLFLTNSNKMLNLESKNLGTKFIKSSGVSKRQFKMIWKLNFLIFTKDFSKNTRSFSRLLRLLKHVALKSLLLHSNTICKFSKNLILSMRNISTTTKVCQNFSDFSIKTQTRLCVSSNASLNQTWESILTQKIVLAPLGSKGCTRFSGTSEPRRFTKSKLVSLNAVP